MRFRSLAALAVLLFALPLFSQQSPTQTPSSASAPNSPPPQAPVRDPQALTLLQASIRAMGSAPPSDSTATGTVTQTIGAQSQSGTIQIQTRGTDQSSETLTLPNSSETTTFGFWMGSRATGNGAPQDITSQLAASSQTVIFPLPLLSAALNSPDESVQYVASENVDGVATQHIRVSNTFFSKPYLSRLAVFTPRDIWIDTTSNLPRRISFTQQDGGGAVPKFLIQMDFSNYQPSSGFAYPRTIAKSQNGTPSLTITIQNVVFNTGLSDLNFPVNCSGSSSN